MKTLYPHRLAVKIVFGLVLVAMGTVIARSPLWQQPEGIASLWPPFLLVALVIGGVCGLLYIAEKSYYKPNPGLAGGKKPLHAKKWRDIGIVVIIAVALGCLIVFKDIHAPNPAGRYFLGAILVFAATLWLDIKMGPVMKAKKK